MKITIRTKETYLLAKDTPYFHVNENPNSIYSAAYYDSININKIGEEGLTRIVYPAIVRIGSITKYTSGIIRIDFSWFTDEMNLMDDIAKYLLICPDIFLYIKNPTETISNKSISSSLVAHYVIPLSEKLKAIVKRVDDFHEKMASLRTQLADLNHEIDKHVKYHEELRITIPDELFVECPEAEYAHKEFISYNNEVANFISEDTK